MAHNPSKPHSDSGFGTCPICREDDGFLNIEATHWFVCHTHQVKWRVGSNLFSGWREEDAETWFSNELLLTDYREVESAE